MQTKKHRVYINYWKKCKIFISFTRIQTLIRLVGQLEIQTIPALKSKHIHQNLTHSIRTTVIIHPTAVHCLINSLAIRFWIISVSVVSEAVVIHGGKGEYNYYYFLVLLSFFIEPPFPPFIEVDYIYLNALLYMESLCVFAAENLLWKFCDDNSNMKDNCYTTHICHGLDVVHCRKHLCCATGVCRDDPACVHNHFALN